MENIRDQLKSAQAAGDLAGCRAALLEAKTKGADPVQIDQALKELDQVVAARDEAMKEGGKDPIAPSPPAAEAQASSSAAPSAVASSGAAPSGAAPSGDDPEVLRGRAEGLKKKGNEKLKENTKAATKEAVEFFTAGLEVGCSDAVLNAQLHGNRAHVRIFKLRQFVEAVDDCRKAIELDPKNIKNYYRAAKASFHLDFFKNGIDFADQGLRVDPGDADLLKMKEACVEKLATQQQRKTEIAEARRSGGDFNADDAMAVQEKVSNLGEQMDTIRNTAQMKGREKMKAELTKSEMKDLSADVNAYIAVGRTFLKEDKPVIEKKLDDHLEKLEKELPSLQKSYDELSKRKADAEQELKEMIEGFKSQQQQQSASAA